MAITKLTSNEIDSVGGAGTKVGAAMTLGGLAMGTVGGILAFTPLAAIGGVLIIGGAGIGALAYAYDGYADRSLGGGGGGGGAGGIGGGGSIGGTGVATRIPSKAK